MNWPYIHTLINHFPIILSVVGCAVLLLAVATGRRAFWLYALATLTMAGVGAYPAYFSGNQASSIMRHVWYVEPAMIREHDQAAGFALASLLMMGGASAYLWWRMLRRDTLAPPPKWMRVVVVLVALWSLSVVVRTAYLGGQIVHDSPKLQGPAPAGMAVDTTASFQPAALSRSNQRSA